jgi:HSP20 family protein
MKTTRRKVMTHWNPLHDLVTLQDRMNRLFEDASQRHAERNVSQEMEGADWYPPADVSETEAEYTIAVDLPGIDRGALDISVDENRLTIKGTRGNAEEVKQHRSECPRGNFIRTFTVPGVVDQGKITASYKDGVLRVALPRKAQRQSQKVEIKVS